MDKHLEEQLENINSNIPKVNPNLKGKIYYQVVTSSKMNNHKCNHSFFTKHFKIALTSVIVVFILFIGLILSNYPIFEKDFNSDAVPPFDSSSVDGSINDSEIIPSDPVNLNFSINCVQAIFTEDYDIVTVCVKNKVKHLYLCLFDYQSTLLDVKLNNGEAFIDHMTGSSGFSISINNLNTRYHYIDLYYPKNTFSSEESVVDFLMAYSSSTTAIKYKYELRLNNIIMQRSNS